MTLDIQQPEFWNLDSVDHELRRVYDICSGCRRCLPLCPSFKVMFDRLDTEAVDGDVEKLPLLYCSMYACGRVRFIRPAGLVTAEKPRHGTARLSGRANSRARSPGPGRRG